MDTLKPLSPLSLPNKNQFYSLKYKVQGPAKVPGGSSQGARRVQPRCPAGPAEVPGRSSRGARRVQLRCPADPAEVLGWSWQASAAAEGRAVEEAEGNRQQLLYHRISLGNCFILDQTTIWISFNLNSYLLAYSVALYLFSVINKFWDITNPNLHCKLTNMNAN